MSCVVCVVGGARVEVLLVAHNLLLHVLTRHRVGIGGHLHRIGHVDAQVHHEVAREVVRIGQQEDAAVEVNRRADVEVGNPIEATV